MGNPRLVTMLAHSTVLCKRAVHKCLQLSNSSRFTNIHWAHTMDPRLNWRIASLWQICAKVRQ